MLQSNLKALFAVIAIGEKYNSDYRNLFYSSHKAYCLKYGYDLLIVDDFIAAGEVDKSLISLQKILVCSLSGVQEKYDYVVFIDSDILINCRIAPPITECIVDDGCVYLVDEYSQPSKKGRLEINRKIGWEDSAAGYYKLCNFEIKTDSVLSTGVMVLNPKIHKEICERIYLKGATLGRNHSRGFHYEQSLIGYVFQKERYL